MAKKEPLLTVLVVTYNHQETIAETLDSILKQKTQYPYTVWIAEDCSTDNTLEICNQYIQKYPDKIKVFAQQKNTKAKHIRDVITKIKTPYLAILEGDDYWTDENKIQIALDFLENNPTYSTFAHDTLYRDNLNGTSLSLVHDIHKVQINNPVNIYEAPYLHTSARVYRNTVDLKSHFKDEPIVGDINLFYAYLDKGALYYHDKSMSVYNINGTGSWTKHSKAEQARQVEMSHYRNNQLLDYRHDDFFTAKALKPQMLRYLKKVFGPRYGWWLYIFMLKNKVIK